MSINEMINSALKSKVLNHQNAPGLMRTMEELNARAGTNITKVRLLPTNVVNAAYFLAEDSLWLTQGLCKALDSGNLHKTPSLELQYVISHELGHAKHKWGHFGPQMGIITAGSLLALGTFHVVTRSFDRINEQKKSDPTHPETFWQALGETTDEMKQKGLGWSLTETLKTNYPLATKMLSADPRFKDMSWGKAFIQSAKATASFIALTIPVYAACKPHALSREWEADRFAIAVMGDGKPFADAMIKLNKGVGETVKSCARTPVEKHWAVKIAEAYPNFQMKNMHAHPPTIDRINFAKTADVAALKREFSMR